MESKLSIKKNISFLIGHMKSFKVNFINFYCGMLTQTSIEILAPIILGLIINEIVYYKNEDTFLILCGLYSLMIVFQCCNYFLIYANHHYLNSMYVFKIRTQLFKKIIYGQSVSLSNINAGEATAVIDEYTDDCLHFVVRNFIHFLNNILVIVWCIYFLLRIDVRFGMFLFLILLAQILITLSINHKLMKLSDEKMLLYGFHLRFLSSILTALKDIQLLTAEFFITKIYKEKFWDYKEKEYKIQLQNYKLEKYTEGLHTLLLLVIYLFCMFLILDKQMLLGTFLTVITYFEVMKGKSLYVISLLSNFNENLSKIDRVRQMFTMKTEKEAFQGNKKVKELKGHISFQNCSFSYDTKPILKNVTFEIEQGEKVALVGASGVGKSTVLSLLMGLYSLTEGIIEVDGQDIRNIDIYSLRKNISVVNQEIFILNDTIRNNLLIVNKAADEQQLEEVLKISELNVFVSSLPEGLDTVLEKDGKNLSGGQKQRIALARAFLKNSNILLLDEFTSSLDTDTEQKINKAISETKKTMLIVSHRFHTISHCDKVVVIQNGRVKEVGCPAELMERRGALYQLFRV